MIAETEARLGTRHLIAQNVCNHRFPVRDVDPRVSILNFHYAWPEAATLNLGLRRVVAFDETGFATAHDRVAAAETDAVYRRQAWEFLMAGGGVFDMLDYSFAVGHEDGTLVNDAPGGAARRCGASSASSRTSCTDSTSPTWSRGRSSSSPPRAPSRGRSAPGRRRASTSGAAAARASCSTCPRASGGASGPTP